MHHDDKSFGAATVTEPRTYYFGKFLRGATDQRPHSIIAVIAANQPQAHEFVERNINEREPRPVTWNAIDASRLVDFIKANNAEILLLKVQVLDARKALEFTVGQRVRVVQWDGSTEFFPAGNEGVIESTQAGGFAVVVINGIRMRIRFEDLEPA